jgi:hypothetical protein
MHQQLWGYKVEEKLYVGVREQKRLNTTALHHHPAVTLHHQRHFPIYSPPIRFLANFYGENSVISLDSDKCFGLVDVSQRRLEGNIVVQRGKPRLKSSPPSMRLLILISGFRRYVDEICALLGYYAASCGNLFPSFRDNISVPASRVKSLTLVLRCWPSSHLLIATSHRESAL